MVNAQEIVERHLETGDHIAYTWPASFKETNGKIVLSKEKLFFIEEKGFIFTTANLMWEVSYKTISRTDVREPNQLVVHADSGEYIIETQYLSNLAEAVAWFLKKETAEEALTIPA